MRLIDADALIDALDISDEDIIFKEMLEDAPTIDAVPVIRCKDCRHRYITGDTTHYYVCDFMDAEYNDNGYCHNGEGKDNDII